MDNEARVDSYMTPLDAELAKAYLESHGIRVRLEGEELMGAAFALGPMLGGVTLFVDKEAGESARHLLREYHRRLLERPAPQRESPDERVDRAWISAFVGFVTIPLLVHAYSIWILLHVSTRDLSPKARKRYIVAWVIDALALAAASWIVLRAWG